MLGMIDTATVTISISGIELLALKKLSLVSHALADKIGGPSGREQTCLAKTLDDLVRQIELNATQSTPPHGGNAVQRRQRPESIVQATTERASS